MHRAPGHVAERSFTFQGRVGGVDQGFAAPIFDWTDFA